MTDAPTYPGYDVLAKRDTPSWNQRSRDVIDARLAAPDTPHFFTAAEWKTADALGRRIVPQPGEADAVSLAAQLDAKLRADHGDGFRAAGMPYMCEAWRQGLAALDAEARARHGCAFADLPDEAQDALLGAMQRGEKMHAEWPFAAQAFFEHRVLGDVPALFYAMPKAWNEIGFGGPASPRGYVRLDGDRPDPWEAAEATPDDAARAERENRHVV